MARVEKPASPAMTGPIERYRGERPPGKRGTRRSVDYLRRSVGYYARRNEGVADRAESHTSTRFPPSICSQACSAAKFAMQK